MRRFNGFWKIVNMFLVFSWVIIVIFTAVRGAWHPIIQGATFLSFGLALIFINIPIDKEKINSYNNKLLKLIIFGEENSPSILDCAMSFSSIIICLYVPFNWDQIMLQSWDYQTYEIVFSAILVILLLEAARRSTGKIIPIMVSLFISYALLGHLLSGIFCHPGFSLSEILYHFYMKNEGVWGILTDTVCRIIAIFLLLGPILIATGAGKMFINIAKFFGGRTIGGAGQIAVISSALFGMLSGSATSNVVTTGNLTIPTMKKLGYEAEFAGAVESSASCGGQIMPPIMGVGAFVMAEILGVSYLHIAIAAIIPALVYFIGAACGVYFYAKKNKLGKIPLDQIPNAKEVFNLKDILKLFIPLGILVYYIARLLPPQLGAGWALISSILLFVLFSGEISIKSIVQRIKFISNALYDGTIKGMAPLIVMSICVQLGVSLITLTGLSVKMTEVILSLAGVSILLSLALSMLTAMILGMGMPTTAAYIIAASVLAPSLIRIGVPALASHLFIFYFSVLANITPPVCVAIYAAVTIAGGNWLKMAFKAISISIGAYLIPYLFIFYPGLILKGSFFDILLSTILAITVTFFLTGAVLGYVFKETSIPERFLFIIGAVLLVFITSKISIVGIIFLIIGSVLQLFFHKKITKQEELGRYA